MIPAASSLPTPSHFTFVLGKVHGEIGGPTRTIWGYVTGLSTATSSCTVTGIGSAQDLQDNFSNTPQPNLVPISGGIIQRVLGLLSLYRRTTQSSPILLVGVWHFPFFFLGTIHVFASFLGLNKNKSIVLVPTMSLTEYDWAKHSRLKKILRPLVALILRNISGIVFASSGEMQLSGPSSWERATVILHPTVSAQSDTSAGIPSTRDIDLLFVGRIDPQKDIPLLLQSFARMDSRRCLDLVGSGDESYVAELTRLSSDLGIAERVRWHGWKSHSETLDLMQRSKSVAVTSVVENYCHVAVEALVSGCELILVDRVMSAPDFAALADIDIVEPEPNQIAVKVDARLDSWPARAEARAATAKAVRDACSPEAASVAMRKFVSEERNF